MQAMSTMKRFVFSRTGGMAVALSIVIGGVIGVMALPVGDGASNEHAIESARVMPHTYTSIGQGEGLVGPGGATDRSLLEPRSTRVTVLSSPHQGEGLVDPSNHTSKENLLRAWSSPGQGERPIGPVE